MKNEIRIVPAITWCQCQAANLNPLDWVNIPVEDDVYDWMVNEAKKKGQSIFALAVEVIAREATEKINSVKGDDGRALPPL
jgi:hypothetical protein